jgi:hypothetical protein
VNMADGGNHNLLGPRDFAAFDDLFSLADLSFFSLFCVSGSAVVCLRDRCV